jgi:hypothetical protein
MMKMFYVAATSYIAYSISYIVKNDSETQYDLRTTIYGFSNHALRYALCAMRFC